MSRGQVSSVGFRVPGTLSLFIFIAWLILGMSPVMEAALTVSPGRIVLQAKPSQSRTGFFTVENQGDEPVEFTVELEDWSGGIGGKRQPVAWMTVRPKRLTLKPRKAAKVTYRLHVPDDARGELRTQAFFTTTAQGSVMMRSRLGVIVYVAVQGTEQIAATVTKVDASYTASTPGATRPDRLELLMRIRNGGNAHIVPEGKVVIRDRDGWPAATIHLKPGWGLLPKEEETYHAIGDGVVLKPGRYTVEMAIECGGDLRRPTTVTQTLQAVVTDEGRLDLLDSGAPAR